MDDDTPRPVPPDLLAALERSRGDVVAGRVVPARPMIDAMRRRALERIAAREIKKAPAARR